MLTGHRNGYTDATDNDGSALPGLGGARDPQRLRRGILRRTRTRCRLGAARSRSGCCPSAISPSRSAAGSWQLADTSTNGTFSTARTTPSAPATCAACVTAIGCASVPMRSRCVWWRTTTHVQVALSATARSPIRSRWIRSRQPRPQRNPFDEPDHLRPRNAANLGATAARFRSAGARPARDAVPRSDPGRPFAGHAGRVPPAAPCRADAAARRRRDPGRRPAAGRLGQGPAGGHLLRRPNAGTRTASPSCRAAASTAQGRTEGSATCHRTRRTGRRTATSGCRPARRAPAADRARTGGRRRCAARRLPRGRRPAGCARRAIRPRPCSRWARRSATWSPACAPC